VPSLLELVSGVLAHRYPIERELGRGGMATVYLARDPKHGRLVALKVLRPDLVATLGSARFLREIEVAARLTHPHILPLHDSGEAEGLLYYVMPYIDGESVRDRLNRETRLPAAEAVKIGGYFNSGQDCTASSRILVSDRIYDDVLSATTSVVEAMTVGDPGTDDEIEMGPVISQEQQERVLGFLERLDGKATVVAAAPIGVRVTVSGGAVSARTAPSGSSPSDSGESRMTSMQSGSRQASTKAPMVMYAVRQPKAWMSHATVGTMRLIPAMAALPSTETAVPRRATNQRDTTALATTGPVAASPTAASTPYTAASSQIVRQNAVRTSAVPSTTHPHAVTRRAPSRSTRAPMSGMKAP